MAIYPRECGTFPKFISMERTQSIPIWLFLVCVIRSERWIGQEEIEYNRATVYHNIDNNKC